jgi:hypothetical protein
MGRLRLKNLATVGNGVEVGPSKLGLAAGNGVFATRPFKKNELITEYDGELLSYDEARRREKEQGWLAVSHYRAVILNWQTLAGLRAPVAGKGAASMINDAEPSIPRLRDTMPKVTGDGQLVKNNVRFVSRWDEGVMRNRIFACALRDIAAGEELFVSYERDYWRKFAEVMSMEQQQDFDASENSSTVDIAQMTDPDYAREVSNEITAASVPMEVDNNNNNNVDQAIIALTEFSSTDDEDGAAVDDPKKRVEYNATRAIAAAIIHAFLSLLMENNGADGHYFLRESQVEHWKRLFGRSTVYAFDAILAAPDKLSAAMRVAHACFLNDFITDNVVIGEHSDKLLEHNVDMETNGAELAEDNGFIDAMEHIATLTFETLSRSSAKHVSKELLYKLDRFEHYVSERVYLFLDIEPSQENASWRFYVTPKSVQEKYLASMSRIVSVLSDDSRKSIEAVNYHILMSWFIGKMLGGRFQASAPVAWEHALTSVPHKISDFIKSLAEGGSIGGIPEFILNRSIEHFFLVARFLLVLLKEHHVNDRAKLEQIAKMEYTVSLIEASRSRAGGGLLDDSQTAALVVDDLLKPIAKMLVEAFRVDAPVEYKEFNVSSNSTTTTTTTTIKKRKVVAKRARDDLIPQMWAVWTTAQQVGEQSLIERADKLIYGNLMELLKVAPTADVEICDLNSDWTKFITDALKRKTRLSSSSRILEVGCRAGTSLIQIALTVSAGAATGVELGNTQLVELAKEALQQLREPKEPPYVRSFDSMLEDKQISFVSEFPETFSGYTHVLALGTNQWDGFEEMHSSSKFVQLARLFNDTASSDTYYVTFMNPAKMRLWYDFHVQLVATTTSIKDRIFLDRKMMKLFIYKKAESTTELEQHDRDANLEQYNLNIERHRQNEQRRKKTYLLKYPMLSLDHREADHEKDCHIKHTLYYEAIRVALRDIQKRVTNNNNSSNQNPVLTIRVCVVGNGSNWLLRQCLRARADVMTTTIPVEIYVIESSDHGVKALRRIESNLVHIIQGDVRKLNSAMVNKEGLMFDLVVSDLLGSFADNELAPECLYSIDNEVLREDTLWIPSKYTSYVMPCRIKDASDVLTNQSRLLTDATAIGSTQSVWLLQSEVYEIDLVKAALSKESQKFIEYEHRGLNKTVENNNNKDVTRELSFTVDVFNSHTERRTLDGFLGYFTAELYDGIVLSIAPDRSPTADLRYCWSPLFFPIAKPTENRVTVSQGHTIKLTLSRKHGTKWLEIKESGNTAGIDPLIALERHSGMYYQWQADIYSYVEEITILDNNNSGPINLQEAARDAPPLSDDARRMKIILNRLPSVDGGKGLSAPIYGEVNFTGMNRIFYLLKKFTGMSEESHFIDIGSGSAVQVLHAALNSVKTSAGIEYDEMRHEQALARIHMLGHPRSGVAPITFREGQIHLIHGAAESMESLEPYTHVYSFDRAFLGAKTYHPETPFIHLAQLFNKSQTLKCYVSFVNPSTLLSYGFDARVLGQLGNLSQAGSKEKMTAYFYVKASDKRVTTTERHSILLNNTLVHNLDGKFSFVSSDLLERVTGERMYEMKAQLATLNLPPGVYARDVEYGVEVRDSTIPFAGKGLFAIKTFKVGDNICPYTGEVLTKEDLDRIYGPRLAVYALSVTKDYFIDAVDPNKSSLARYANDYRGSDDVNSPNARLTGNANSKTARIEAAKTIHPGEEIFLNYGDEYWTSSDGMKIIKKMREQRKLRKTESEVVVSPEPATVITEVVALPEPPVVQPAAVITEVVVAEPPVVQPAAVITEVVVVEPTTIQPEPVIQPETPVMPLRVPPFPFKELREKKQQQIIASMPPAPWAIDPFKFFRSALIEFIKVNANKTAYKTAQVNASRRGYSIISAAKGALQDTIDVDSELIAIMGEFSVPNKTRFVDICHVIDVICDMVPQMNQLKSTDLPNLLERLIPDVDNEALSDVSAPLIRSVIELMEKVASLLCDSDLTTASDKAEERDDTLLLGESLIKYKNRPRIENSRQRPFSIASAKRMRTTTTPIMISEPITIGQPLRLELDITLTEYDLDASNNREYPEHGHRIDVFISPGTLLANSAPVMQSIKLQNAGSGTKVILETDRCKGTALSDTDIVGFQLLRYIKPLGDHNDQHVNYARMEPVGDGVIPISRLIDANTHTVDIYDQCYPRTNFLKARLSVVALEGTRFVQTKGVSSNGDSSSKEELMEGVIHRFFDAFRNRFVASKDSVIPMHVPHYPTNTLCIPASMFMVEQAHDDPQNWQNGVDLLELLLRISININMNGNETAFVSLLESPGDAEDLGYFQLALKTMFDSVTLFANLCDYKQDLSHGADCERFLDVLKTRAGDCEDLAKCIIHFCMILLRVGRGEIANVSSAIMRAAGRAMQAYVPVMIEGEASLPSMKENGGEGEDNSICHIYAAAIPRLQFIKMLQHPTLLKDQVERLEQSLMRYLPVMNWETDGDARMWILEGTNFCNPFQLPINMMCKHADLRDSVKVQDTRMQHNRSKLEMQFASLRSLSAQIQQPATQLDDYTQFPVERLSSFYRRPVTVWTTALIECGVLITDLTVCKNGGGGGGHRDVYGVDFKDWLFMRDNVKLVPTFTLSNEEWQVCREVLSQQSPVLFPRASGTELTLERLEEIKRAYPPTNATVYNLVPNFISYRLNHASKLSDRVIKDVHAILEQRYLGFTGFDYRYTEITDKDFVLVELRLFY